MSEIDNQLDILDQFLLDRGDKNKQYVEAFDEGIFCVSELDGFFTAVVSSKDMIMPSVWLKAIWGDEDYVWEDQKQFESLFGIMSSLYQSIADCLQNNTNKFVPMINERIVDDREFMIVDEWCEGYMRGVSLWNEIPSSVKKLLDGISGFTEKEGWPLHQLSESQIFQSQKAVKDCAINIYKENSKSMFQPAVSTKVGRNDPCVCGGGKKFKKCCLH